MDFLYFFILFGLLVVLPGFLLWKYGDALDRYVLAWRFSDARPEEQQLRRRERLSRDGRLLDDGGRGGWSDGGGFCGGDGGGGGA
jgi:uncharacterized membrane protein YgcG